MTDSSGGSAKTVEKLILDEIAGENSAEETQRLLGTSARGRTEAARSILLSILDHIAEYDSREESSKRHESLQAGTDRA